MVLCMSEDKLRGNKRFNKMANRLLQHLISKTNVTAELKTMYTVQMIFHSYNLDNHLKPNVSFTYHLF
jgi:hypothetical protein